MKFTASLLVLLLLCLPVLYAQEYDGLKKLDGTSLYLKSLGEGEAVVVIHGGPGMNHVYLRPHLDPLSRKYKVVYYDQRASGRSSTPSADSISLKFFADDIEAIRKDLGVEKLNLLGHSWGVIPMIDYALRYPGRVNKMILCDPVPLNHEYDQEMLRNQKAKATPRDSADRSLIRGSKEFRDGKPDAYRKLLFLSFRNSFYDQGNYSKLVVDVPPNYLAASQALNAGLGKELEQYDYYGQLKAFTFPVLILHGEADAIPKKSVEKATASIPGSKVIVFNKSGHFPFIEEPNKFYSTVVSFLKEK